MKVFVVTICGAVALLPVQAQAQQVRTPPAPMEEIAIDGVLTSPLIVDDQGRSRYEGQVFFLVTSTFDPSALWNLDPGIEFLWQGSPSVRGDRLMLAKTADNRVDQLVGELRGHPGVLAADLNVSFAPAAWPNDPQWPGQSNLGASLLNLPSAWDITSGSAAVTVAVIDTGVDPQPDMFVNVLQGSNIVDPSMPPRDEPLIGHGTAVASVIGAAKNNSSQIAGVSPAAQLLRIKVCYVGGSAGIACPGILVAEGVRQASASGADIINLSLIPYDFVSTVEYELQAFWLDFGITVAAAGNESDNEITSPASSQYVIAVGGIQPGGSRHPASNYGEELDIVAPFQTYALDNVTGQAELFDGTSAAAPVIAGLVALHKSISFYDPENPQSAYDTFLFDVTRHRTWGPELGYGVPDAGALLWEAYCSSRDYDGDREITVVDAQTIAYRYGSTAGHALYHPLFDNQPTFGDGECRYS